jgi:hypothetical protein
MLWLTTIALLPHVTVINLAVTLAFGVRSRFWCECFGCLQLLGCRALGITVIVQLLFAQR